MKTLVIYFNSEKTQRQIIKPSINFKGDYAELAQYLANGREYTYATY